MNPAQNHSAIDLASKAGIWFGAICLGGFLVLLLCLTSPSRAGAIVSSLATNLVCYYDFEHPVMTNAARESDLGFSGTDINLINGGAVMRTNDGAYAGSAASLQTQQLNPMVTGNDDWKAGIYHTNGVASLSAFGAIAGITLMGWVKPTGINPNLDTTTASPTDYYNAVGLLGLLSGTSEGHAVRALLEVIDVSGTMRLVALGRRIDTGNSLTLAATNDWRALLPSNTWTHLAATFDFDNGTMALYRNGTPVVATYTTTGDAWGIIGGAEPDLTSATIPAGIKIGGSFPQNTQEKNAFNGRFDDLMFFNRTLTAGEVQLQYASCFPPTISAVGLTNGIFHLAWSAVSAARYTIQSTPGLNPPSWTSRAPHTNLPGIDGLMERSITLDGVTNEFFRVKME